MSKMIIREIGDDIRPAAVNLFKGKWGSEVMVSKGKTHRAAELAGFVAVLDDEVSGLITYEITGGDCEIVSIDSFREGMGVGGALLKAVIDAARLGGCTKVWLVTTNDNTNAMRFYQVKGFDMTQIYRNSIEHARRLKPEIPLYGCDDIPIRHEIEFSMYL